jgi:HD-like signal output (HDOD) protein
MERIDALRQIAAQAQEGELIFPTGLDLAMKLVRQLDDPECHVDQAAKLIKNDPLISARALAVANSAIYNRSGQPISDVRHAVARIGLRMTRSLAVAIATRQMAGEPKTPQLRQAAAQLWSHTAHVAALAQVIARRITHLDPETAFFAGIVHEIGGFYLISRAAEFPSLIDGEPADWAEHAEPLIGRSILNKLAVPANVIEALERTWEGLLSLPPVSLSDTLLLANELAPVTSPLHDRKEGALLHQTHIIDAAVDDAFISSILAESASEVESLSKALQF